MNVYFSTFSKRRNSTKRPSGGSGYSCLLKDDTSTARPSIALKWPGSGSPTAYNYCYIPDFGRYYYVNSWTYTDRQWVADCVVDVLATYKTQIGAESKYVVRAAGTFDLYMPDTLFPVDGKLKTTQISISGLNWANSLSGGSIVIGLMGVDGGYSVGGVSYYRVTPAGYMTLLKELYSESLAGINGESYGSTIGQAIEALSRNMLRSITNPQQYIKSVRWYPFSFSEGGGVTVRIGGIQTTPTLYPISDPIKTQTITMTFSTMPNTPMEYWANVSPYLEATAFIPPFGTFPLDTRKLCDATGCSLEIITDAISGQAHMRLFATRTGADPVLAESITTIGIPMDSSGVSYGSGVSLGSVAGAVGSAITGDYLGAAAGIASAFDSGVGKAEAHSAAYSGIAGFQAPKFIQMNYMNAKVTTDDYDECGHAVGQVMTLSGLSGYILCADGHVDCPATDAEHAQIEAFLTGGFFYE